MLAKAPHKGKGPRYARIVKQVRISITAVWHVLLASTVTQPIRRGGVIPVLLVATKTTVDFHCQSPLLVCVAVTSVTVVLQENTNLQRGGPLLNNVLFALVGNLRSQRGMLSAKSVKQENIVTTAQACVNNAFRESTA